MREQFVSTPVGRARLDWFPAAGNQRAVVVLGHGTATGVEAPDLQALASVLPPRGFTVALVTQPYRVEGNLRVAGEPSLDRAWTAIWPSLSDSGSPVIAGGRSAGSQVACRTASELGARAVLALAYPLLGPGSPAELLATHRPTLVIQGGQDPFGRPGQFPKLPPDMDLVEIPSTNHMFTADSPSGSSKALSQLTHATIAWLEQQLSRDHDS
jgi:predicted alpha/beta-hydrolase family hydrolase